MRAGSNSARAADLQLTAFGTVLHLRQIPEALLQKCLLPDWQLERPDREPHVILECDARTGAPGSLRLLAEQKTVSQTPFTVENLLESLDQSLHLAIAEFSPQAIFVHAGVCVRNGAAVIVPGRSHAGKSTLIKALADAGATYYSDEFAPILPDGSVIPYPKPLLLRSPGQGLDPSRNGSAKVEPGTLGWKSDLPPVPIGIVAAVSYRPEEPGARPTAISKAEATALLLDNTVPMLRAPTRSLRSLSRATRRARCLGGSRGEASGFARDLLRVLAAEVSQSATSGRMR